MRKALNENPMVQLGVLAVGGLVLVVMLFSTVLRGEEPVEETATPATATAPSSGAAPTEAAPSPATPSPGAAPTTPGTAAPAPDVAPTQPEGDFAAGEGLPRDVVRAYEQNKAIVLLVADPGGVSDDRMRDYTRRIESRGDSDVFLVDVGDVADYSRITSGVSVNRAPALVVVRPKNLDGGAPTATVDYGFLSPAVVEQAVDDDLYDGREVTPYP